MLNKDFPPFDATWVNALRSNIHVRVSSYQKHWKWTTDWIWFGVVFEGCLFRVILSRFPHMEVQSHNHRWKKMNSSQSFNFRYFFACIQIENLIKATLVHFQFQFSKLVAMMQAAVHLSQFAPNSPLVRLSAKREELSCYYNTRQQ